MHSHEMHAGRQPGSLQLVVRSDQALLSVTGWHSCTLPYLVFLVIYLHVLSSVPVTGFHCGVHTWGENV